MRVSLKAIAGVESVDVSLNQGLATAQLRPGNNVRLEQLRRAIAKNGFTTKEARVAAIGRIIAGDNGKNPQLKVEGSNESFELVFASTQQLKSDLQGFAGKSVLLEGTVPSAEKGRSADLIQVKSVKGA